MARHAAPGGGPGDALNGAAEATLTLYIPLDRGGRRVAPMALDAYIEESMIMLDLMIDIWMGEG